jgi:hypothetical protein
MRFFRGFSPSPGTCCYNTINLTTCFSFHVLCNSLSPIHSTLHSLSFCKRQMNYKHYIYHNENANRIWNMLHAKWSVNAYTGRLGILVTHLSWCSPSDGWVAYASRISASTFEHVKIGEKWLKSSLFILCFTFIHSSGNYSFLTYQQVVLRHCTNYIHTFKTEYNTKRVMNSTEQTH